MSQPDDAPLAVGDRIVMRYEIEIAMTVPSDADKSPTPEDLFASVLDDTKQELESADEDCCIRVTEIGYQVTRG